MQLILRGKSTTQSYRQPVYYVDLTLRDGISLNDAIRTAKEIDQQSKDAGFYQEALDHVAKVGFANARFEVNSEDGMDVLEGFYAETSFAQEKGKSVSLKTGRQCMSNIQQELKDSVQVMN